MCRGDVFKVTAGKGQRGSIEHGRLGFLLRQRMFMKNLLCVGYRLDTGARRMNATESLVLNKSANQCVYSIYSRHFTY